MKKPSLLFIALSLWVSFVAPGCATGAGVEVASATGWTTRAHAALNPHLAFLEGQTRGATASTCVPGPTWPDTVPEERRLKPRVEILEFTDFQCPYCAHAQPALARVLEHFGPCTVRITTVPKPLAFHAHARKAAQAAASAALLGPHAHERVHRVLFEEGSDLEASSFEALPKLARVDPVHMSEHMESLGVKAFVEWGTFVGDHGDARGTPTFFVNGHQIRGAQAYETFAALVEQELTLSRGKEGRWGDDWLVGRLALNAPVLYALLLEGRDATELEPEDVVAEAEEDEEVPEIPSEPEIHEVPIGPEDAIRGNPKASVTIVTFSEFQCPFSVRLHGILKRIEKHYGSSVRFVSKHLPLAFHEHARPAAKAAVCAQLLGDPWPYHDALYEAGSTALAGTDYDQLAGKLGLDVKAFKRCRAQAEADARIDADMTLAGELGVRGTPTTFVNGFRLDGAQGFAYFKAVIDAALGPEADP